MQSADGAWWEMAIPGEGVRIECFGGKSDWENLFVSYTDNLVAYRKAETCVTSHYLAAVGGVGGYQDKKGGPTILFGHGGKYQSQATDDYAGRGSYGFSGPIVPERTVHLKGVSSANIDEATATDLVFPGWFKGLILLPRRPDPAFPTDPTKDLAGAWGSCFENIAFRSVGFGGSMVAHGCKRVYFSSQKIAHSTVLAAMATTWRRMSGLAATLIFGASMAGQHEATLVTVFTLRLATRMPVMPMQ